MGFPVKFKFRNLSLTRLVRYVYRVVIRLFRSMYDLFHVKIPIYFYFQLIGGL